MKSNLFQRSESLWFGIIAELIGVVAAKMADTSWWSMALIGIGFCLIIPYLIFRISAAKSDAGSKDQPDISNLSISTINRRVFLCFGAIFLGLPTAYSIHTLSKRLFPRGKIAFQITGEFDSIRSSLNVVVFDIQKTISVGRAVKPDDSGCVYVDQLHEGECCILAWWISDGKVNWAEFTRRTDLKVESLAQIPLKSGVKFGKLIADQHFDYKSKVLNFKRHTELSGAVNSSSLHSNRIICYGGTDKLGGEDYNRKLGLARAKGVANSILIRAGIRSDQIVCVSWGMDEAKIPITDPKNTTLYERDRLVRIVFLE